MIGLRSALSVLEWDYKAVCPSESTYDRYLVFEHSVNVVSAKTDHYFSNGCKMWRFTQVSSGSSELRPLVVYTPNLGSPKLVFKFLES